MRREDHHRTEVDVQEEADTVRDRDGRLPNGTVIEGYVIDGVLGKGGMGIVYSATHEMIGKRAAIKVLRMEVSKNPMHLQRFIQEARAVNAIGHPNIIDIFDFGQLPDGRAFHLMDLMTGESLRQRLRRGPLHPSEAASVIEQVASALMAAHDKGFVHRDLKPDNVYLIPVDGQWADVKLLDFGLAKLMPEAGTAAFITKTGVMLGTPEYMSPEQARGESVDYRTDVYALGIVMYEILAGERPFPTTGDAFITLQYHAEEMPPSIGAAVPQLPAEMVQLVDAMLKKDPYARPSLAAVRTVIKRLRTTKLPTHSIAGQEIASYSNPNMAAIGPSKLGASPIVPPHTRTNPSQPYDQYSAHSIDLRTASGGAARPASAGLAMTPAPQKAQAQIVPSEEIAIPRTMTPGTQGPAIPPGNLVPPSRPPNLTEAQQELMRTTPRPPSRPPSNMVGPSRPANMTEAQQDLMRTTPRPPPSNLVDASSTSDEELRRTLPRSGTGPNAKLSDAEQEQLRTLPRNRPQSGLAGPGAQPHASTTLGVPPPPKQAASPSRGDQKTARPTSNVWIILGALLFIGAGIALAFVLVA